MAKEKNKPKNNNMPKEEFTVEEKSFLGNTPYRWIGIGLVSYKDIELTKELREELERRGLEVSRKGKYTTVFCKKC